jgi:hypothetical protein
MAGIITMGYDCVIIPGAVKADSPFKWQSYKWEFVMTEFGIMEFDCILFFSTLLAAAMGWLE